MDTDVAVKLGAIGAFLAALWVLTDWERYRRRALWLGRALHLVPPAPAPAPRTGPPIQRIAADAARIRSQIRRAAPGTPVARLRGWKAAYDDVLVAACQALDLEQHLRVLPEGPLRDLERERVERLLVAAGLLPTSP